MHNLKRILIVATLLIVMATATGAYSAAELDRAPLGDNSLAPNVEPLLQDAVSRQTDEPLIWPEAGLTMQIPSGWQLVGSQNFDFVVIDPTAEAGNVFIGLQSGLFDHRTQTLEEVMNSVSGDVADVEATTLDDVEAWQFEFVDESQHLIVIGFITTPTQINLLVLSAPEAEWDVWGTTYQQVLDDLTLEPLELDHDELNAQMQDNLATHGKLLIGNAEAEVQFVEVFDFSCGHCANFSPAVSRLIGDYVVQDERVSVELAILTGVGGEYSVTATLAQYCGTSLGVGWDMHELIFAEYATKGVAEAYNADNLIEAIANANFEVDMEAFETCMQGSDEFDAFLQQNVAFATEYGISSTPTILLGSNGELEIQQSRALLLVYEQLDSMLE